MSLRLLFYPQIFHHQYQKIASFSELRGHIIGLVLVAKTVAATLPYVFFEVESVEFKTSVTFFASQIIFHRQNISQEGSVVEK